MKSLPTLAAVFATLLPLVTASPVRGGNITVMNLPSTGTDLATGITTNKTYVSAFNFGSQNTTVYSVNSVPFAHPKTAANNIYLSTNWVDTVHGGQVIASTSAANKGVDVTSSGTQGNLAAQADGNMRSILTDVMYSGNGGPIGGWLQEEFDNLTIGHQYSLRIYYRFWGNAVGDRTQDFSFNGEGTWQQYSGNPLDEDLGTNGTAPNGATCQGARFIQYDFTADATNVFCLASNLVANGATMIAGSTLEDDSVPYAPFFTYQPSAVESLSGTYTFSAEAIGTPSLSFQWYSNSISSYSGATMVTDSADFSGSASSNLTTTATTTTNELLNYYFVVAANAQGYTTSSIVRINPAPGIVTQPTSTNVANSYVQFNMAANGFLPLAYQWYINTASNYTGATMLTDGNGVSGSATNSLTTTTNLQDYYFVVVTNTFGSVTSAITEYNPLPVIVKQPSASKVGSSVVMSVTASGWPTLAYQWYFNTTATYSGSSVMTDGNGISGSTTSSVTITNLTDYYYVVVTNYYGVATSQVMAAAIQLTVTSAGEPIWNPTTQTNIIITFSDQVSPATATTLVNYSLSPTVSIQSAALVSSNEVSLTTAPLSPTTSYTLTVSGVKDLIFNIAMAPASTNLVVGAYPADIVLWVRADTGVTADGSGNVSQWNDMSPFQNDLYTISAVDPLLVTNSYGDPVIRFTGTNASQMAAYTSGSLGILGDMSIIAVMNFATLAGGTNGDIVSKTGTGAPGGQSNIPAPYDYYVGSTADLLRGNGGSSGIGNSYGVFGATNGPSVGVPQILAVSETGNTVSHFLDGQGAGTGLLGNGYQETNDFDQSQYLTVGERLDNHNVLAGDMSELIVAGSPISSYDVTQMTSYLAQEHHVVFVNTNPTNLLFSVTGGQMTLSWPADHIGWTLQAQTNSVSGGLGTNWVNVTGSSGVDQMVVPVNVANGCVFYRLIYNP